MGGQSSAATSMGSGPLFDPLRLGPVELPNRIVRAATSEALGLPDGSPSDALRDLYETFARNQVGLIITGHLYVDRRGMYVAGQPGIDSDGLIAPWRRITDTVHAAGGKIFAELAHAGSQCRVPDENPMAPSPVPNELTGREVDGATEDEIAAVIDSFGQGARRAMEAGFDGVHIHGANGYLISEFSSALTNHRTDEWGGSAAKRDRFAVELVKRVRAEVPADRAMTMKIGFYDAVPAEEGGLGLEESLPRAERLVTEGLDGIEVSCNVMRLPSDSAATYVAVDRRRAAEDLLFHRLTKEPKNGEAYFLSVAQALRAKLGDRVKIQLVGGMRSRETMETVLQSGVADLVAMSRPFIREPDLARQLAEGRTGRVDCVSCNICLMHEGHHSLRCWRTPRKRLLQHAAYRFSGGFKRAPTINLKH